jgi:DNA-binding NarL/FixJ family response regulator
MIRLLVVDDHTLVRAGLCRLLDSAADIEVVGQAGTGPEALRKCEELKPDVVVLDFKLPELDGLEVTQRIRALGLDVRILILTMYANAEYATRSLRAGASGFIVKAASTDELLEAVRKVAARQTHVMSTLLEQMVAHFTPEPADAPESALSDREMQVLLRLATGASSREVSQALSLSLSTVETHRSHILAKLELRNNSDLTRFAIRRGLIDAD